MYELVKAIKALADETRLRMINLLLVRECCVCEIMQALEISQTRASRNLTLLYDAGFLKLRKEGLWSFYSIQQEETSRYPGKLVEAVATGLAGNDVAAEDRQRLRETVRLGTACYPGENRVCADK